MCQESIQRGCQKTLTGNQCVPDEATDGKYTKMKNEELSMGIRYLQVRGLVTLLLEGYEYSERVMAEVLTSFVPQTLISFN